MQHITTDRGFQIIKFIDLDQQTCSIQKSSLAFEDAIWFGPDEDRAHLTQEMVKQVLLPLFLSYESKTLLFYDRYKQLCSFKSFDYGDIYFGVERNVEGHTDIKKMHIDSKILDKLLPILEYFYQTGKLPVD